MDYQEALEKHVNECRHRIDVIRRHVNTNGDANTNRCLENIKVLETTISAMQELMKYKKIGTLEDLMKLKERELSGVELAKISCNLNHLEKYKQIGTLEKVREAVEKQRKVKPEDGEYCPICHTFLKDEDDVPGFYCMNCGQAIDWSGEYEID